MRVCGKSVHEILCDTLILQVTRPLGKLYFWGECPNSGGGFQPPCSGWKPLPLCAAKLREGHTSKVRPKGDKFSLQAKRGNALDPDCIVAGAPGNDTTALFSKEIERVSPQ